MKARITTAGVRRVVGRSTAIAAASTTNPMRTARTSDMRRTASGTTGTFADADKPAEVLAGDYGLSAGAGARDSRGSRRRGRRQRLSPVGSSSTSLGRTRRSPRWRRTPSASSRNGRSPQPPTARAGLWTRPRSPRSSRGRRPRGSQPPGQSHGDDPREEGQPLDRDAEQNSPLLRVGRGTDADTGIGPVEEVDEPDDNGGDGHDGKEVVPVERHRGRARIGSRTVW